MASWILMNNLELPKKFLKQVICFLIAILSVFGKTKKKPAKKTSQLKDLGLQSRLQSVRKNGSVME